MGEPGRDLHRGPPAEERGRGCGHAGLRREKRRQRHRRRGDESGAESERRRRRATVPLVREPLSPASGPAAPANSRPPRLFPEPWAPACGRLRGGRRCRLAPRPGSSRKKADCARRRRPRPRAPPARPPAARTRVVSSSRLEPARPGAGARGPSGPRRGGLFRYRRRRAGRGGAAGPPPSGGSRCRRSPAGRSPHGLCCGRGRGEGRGPARATEKLRKRRQWAGRGQLPQRARGTHIPGAPLAGLPSARAPGRSRSLSQSAASARAPARPAPALASLFPPTRGPC